MVLRLLQHASWGVLWFALVSDTGAAILLSGAAVVLTEYVVRHPAKAKPWHDRFM